jgi:hypothetical protein
MIVCLIIIYRKVWNVAMVRRNQHLQNQMLLIMLSKTILFLVCTLPYSAFCMATIYSLDSTNQVQYQTFLIVTIECKLFYCVLYSLSYINFISTDIFNDYKNLRATKEYCSTSYSHVSIGAIVYIYKIKSILSTNIHMLDMSIVLLNV